MRDFVAPIFEDAHGPKWFHKLVANEEAKRERPGEYKNAINDLDAGVPPKDILEAKNFPFLIRGNARLFEVQVGEQTGYDFRDLIDRMFTIVELRNKAFGHRRTRGDVDSDDADEFVVQCRRVLSAFGLEDAADAIRRMDIAPETPVPAAPVEDLEFKRFRRSRVREAILAKPESDRSDLEARELRDILLEEEWELRQEERAIYAGLEGTITERLSWFDSVPQRRERHPDLWQTLEEDLAWEAQESARLKGTLTQRLAWFDEDEGRRQRCSSRWNDLQREQRQRGRAEREAEAERERQRAEEARRIAVAERKRELLIEREKKQYWRLSGTLASRRRWFAKVPGRRQRHPSWHQQLEQAEQAQREADPVLREREKQRYDRELADLDRIGENWVEMRRWFGWDRTRRHRWARRYQDLLGAEDRQRSDQRNNARRA